MLVKENKANLYDKYHDQGFEILGISLSDSKESLVNFSKVYNVSYPLLYGNNKEIIRNSIAPRPLKIVRLPSFSRES